MSGTRKRQPSPSTGPVSRSRRGYCLQFADDPVTALREWIRVLRPGGSVAICVWGPREQCEIDVVESALRALAGAPEPRPRLCERLTAVADDAGLELHAHETVSVPFEVADQQRLDLALQFDARGYGVEEGVAREATLAAAAPFRRRDGSYRFENVFRYVISSPSANRTPAPT